MTTLAERKSRLRFETEATSRYRSKDRNIIVECDPSGQFVSFRLKGTKVRYEVSWRGCFDWSAKVAADRVRAEKKAKKAGR